MNMITYHVLIKPDETASDVIHEICDDYAVGPNEPFAFGAIIAPDKQDPGYFKLRINSINPPEENPYTPSELILSLFSQPTPSNKIRYIQPPIEQWLTVFRPLLLTMVNRIHPRYERLIPEREELISIMYLTIITLYNQGYYLHQTLIRKSFINALNMECRKLKGLQNIDSLDAPIDEDDDGKNITLLDQISDNDSTAWARSVLFYTSDDYRSDLFEKVKARMLEDMSELAFERILIQLKSKTVDTNTAHKLMKYRQIFCPEYVPRPNAFGKSKRGRN